MRPTTRSIRSRATTACSLAVGILMIAVLGEGIAFAQACPSTCSSHNTVIGNSTGGGAGNYNTAVGNEALEHNLTAEVNTALGYAALFENTTGAINTAVGYRALLDNTTGSSNTATGDNALVSNTEGEDNTANGASALNQNSTGNGNTAIGSEALFNNTASDNTAVGYQALEDNTSGPNTAIGAGALMGNTTGSENVAIGFNALAGDPAAGSFNTGDDNIAAGDDVLVLNTSGSDNIGVGFNALNENLTGSGNVAIGTHDLERNETGSNNIAVGDVALDFNNKGHGNIALGFEAGQVLSGNDNIAVGFEAGKALTTGSNDIDIGNQGAAGDSNTIRVGTQGTQKKTFVAGISGATVTGAEVVVNSAGQLGVATSSARFKRDIRDMGEASRRLMKLRPVSFFYKDDQAGARQYGLVAEEVEQVYPELVTYGTDGKVETVRYSMLTPMLLNELQRQARDNARQAEQLRKLSVQMAEVTTKLLALEQALHARNTTDRPGAVKRVAENIDESNRGLH